MIHIKQAIIVEGKYDQIRLSSFLDAVIIPTNGFRIFKSAEMLDMIRVLARKCGLIVLTDSDKGGERIRRYLSSAIPKEQMTQVYLPQILGKEKRKKTPSKQGFLGVEGIEQDIILKAFEQCGVLAEKRQTPVRPVTKADFYEDGLTGQDGSAEKRRQLARALDLPPYLSANALITVLNAGYGYSAYRDALSRL